MAGIGSAARRLPPRARRAIERAVNGWDPLRLLVSRRVINGYAKRTPARPRAVSMESDHTTWPGLTDRRFSGRHLPRAGGPEAPAEPPVEEVLALFERQAFRPATDTSLLFPFFAQWFVDSFLRTKWEPTSPRRFRENESNHEIDLCQIYGVSEAQTSMLREGVGGRLRSQVINGEVWPAPLFEERDGGLALAAAYERKPGRGELEPAVPGLYTLVNFQRVFNDYTDEQKRQAFAVGLEHGNSTLGNVAMNALFLREHNRTAGILQEAHPDWGDERLFQTARNVTIAVLLNIVIGDYIVHIAPIDVRLEAEPGMAERQRWYRNNWMAVEFALLYRWHDLVPDVLELPGETLPATAMRHANGWLVGKGLDGVLIAASRQRAGRIGLGNTAKFLLEVKRSSLEMARGCGLASFNAYRRHYGLRPVGSFEALTGEREMAARLRELYGDIDRLEWFVGLFAEGYGEDDMMGELLTTMVANDAFTQALTNPLLAKAVHNEATFGKEGLAIVRGTRTLGEVIARNTGIKDPSLVGFKVVREPAAAGESQRPAGVAPVPAPAE
jgi:prostaglandin-endoperoxide synthase 2